MRDQKKRIGALAVLILYFFVGYGITNRLNMFRDHFFDVSLPFESSIPFIPAFSLGYLTVYIAIFGVYFLYPRWENFKPMAKSFFYLSTIHFLLFLLIPVKMVRPDLSGLGNDIFVNLMRFFYMIDLPVNCFPSLHVAYPSLATCLIWKQHPRWRLLFLFLALLTAVSVVLIKQHYILDAVGGIIISVLVFLLDKNKNV